MVAIILTKYFLVVFHFVLTITKKNGWSYNLITSRGKISYELFVTIFCSSLYLIICISWFENLFDIVVFRGGIGVYTYLQI